MKDLLADLNERQREAVRAPGGPLLILAGAGSGKTRVITTRLAYLIREGLARPREVIAVTFTNKAAGEMKTRVARLLGGQEAGAWVGTFHALCLRILRREGALLGYAPGFLVYDTADQLAVLRGCMKELGQDGAAESARSMLQRISAAKNRLETVDDAGQGAGAPGSDPFLRCYAAYQAGLRKNNALDFDDLLLQALVLFEKFPGVGERYASGTRQLLVDEYQDTNRAQYQLVRFLSARHRNVCCVGDEDQSIFSWRGADIRNILDFQADYPDARIIKLEQNYRSTRTILSAAGAVISHNTARIGKTLWTDNAAGEKLELHACLDDRDEAERALEILRGMQREGRDLGDIAILYRTHSQSRLFEEVFLRERVPHSVVGSLRFYERKEIKDVVAYLRALVSPGDDLTLSRILNVPPRGIGKGTLDALTGIASAERVSLARAIGLALERRCLPARAHKALEEFLSLVEELGVMARQAGLLEAEAGARPGPEGAAPAAVSRGRVTPMLLALLEKIGYAAYLEKAFPGDHEARLLNLDALASAAAEYDEEGAAEGLQGFVDRSSLRSDTDDIQGEPGVTLLTVHSAKGLEFPVVIVTGLEDNVFPHIRSSESREDLEEERRLFYVAMTRARARLFLTAAGARRSFGDFVENPPSRFLEEIPSDLMSERHWAGGGATAWGVRAGAGSWPPARRPRRAERHIPAASRARGEGRVVEEVFFGPDDEDFGYAVGMKVTHPMFGKGTIAAVEGSGPSLKLTIRFAEAGTRRILPRHTTLTIGR